MADEATEEKVPATDAPSEPPPKEETPEPKDEGSEESLDALKAERDKLDQQAGDKEAIPVSDDGEKEKAEKDSRDLIKERAKLLREQKKAAEAQRGTAEQNELVRTKQGSFGEVEGIMPRYKAEADGTKYEEIRRSRVKEWMRSN